ncbi:unnamed protein product [Caenorhabditis nigoni]
MESNEKRPDNLPDMLTDTDYLASEIHQVRSDIKEMAMDDRVSDVEQNKKLLEISNKLDAIEKSISKENSEEMRPSDGPKEQKSEMPVPRCEKEFVLKHVFKNVTSFEEGDYYHSEQEDHFNVNWHLDAKRGSCYLGLRLFCEPIPPSDKWSIQSKLELKVVCPNQNDVIRTKSCWYHQYNGSSGWEKVEKEYLLDGNLTVEAKVTIVETTGLGKEKGKNRMFDESQKHVSDVILVVKDTKFYVSKMYLASQSSFFQSFLIGNYSISDQSEVALPGIDPIYFHSFLEVLYGESAIDDTDVEEVLLLANKFDSSIVKRRCEEFLLTESKKTLKKKQQLAKRYSLEDWNFTCAIANAISKAKQFKLKHVFKDVTSFEEKVDNFSEKEDHFNVNWSIKVDRRNGHLGFNIRCQPVAPPGKWSILTKIEIKVVGRNQNDVIRTKNCWYHQFNGSSGWEKVEKEYLLDGNLTVEAKVTIVETTGLGKEKMRVFNESQKDVSDVILIARDTKFYVSKSFLAAQSIYFKAILFGKSAESEVELIGIDPHDFHYFLEVLYGEYAIDDSTIEGILMIADKYDTQTVVRRCNDFLLNSSKKDLKKKLQISVKYNLGELKKKFMSEITTITDVHSILSEGVNDLDPLIMSELLEKIRCFDLVHKKTFLF